MAATLESFPSAAVARSSSPRAMRACASASLRFARSSAVSALPWAESVSLRSTTSSCPSAIRTCSKAACATACASEGAAASVASPSSTRRAATRSLPSSSSRTASARVRSARGEGRNAAQRFSASPRTRCPSGVVTDAARSVKRRSATWVSASPFCSVGSSAAHASFGCAHISNKSVPRRRASTVASGTSSTRMTRSRMGAGASASWPAALASTSDDCVTARAHSRAAVSQFPTRCSSSASSIASVPSPPSVLRPMRNARRASSYMRRSARASPHSRYGASLRGAAAAQRCTTASRESG